jgi:hypothetical protein
LARRPRVGRSDRPGRLLRLLEADLPGHLLHREGDRVGIFQPRNGGLALTVVERVERRFLGRNEIAQFRVTVPVESARPALLGVAHKGRLRREGLAVEVKEGGQEEALLAGKIESDPGFLKAAMPLDFTKFDLIRSTEGWTVAVELMGASHVSIALPPIRSYVRLFPEQREALLETLGALMRLLKST